MASQVPRQPKAILAENLKFARQKAHLRQRDIAAHLDTDVMTVSRWERGLTRPHDWSLVAMAELYGVDYAWFFTDHKRVEGAAA